MFVNDELNEFKFALAFAEKVLKKGTDILLQRLILFCLRAAKIQILLTYDVLYYYQSKKFCASTKKCCLGSILVVILRTETEDELFR